MTYYRPGGVPRYRPNKRACLKRVFTSIGSALSKRRVKRVQYVTCGGSDLADVKDFAVVLRRRVTIRSVISFENDARLVGAARKSAIASILEVAGVRVDIIPNSFPEGLENKRRPARSQRIIFRDTFGIFDEEDAYKISDMLDTGALLPEDWLIITSSLDERVACSEAFISEHLRRIELFYQKLNPSGDFVRRNFVDALIKLAIDRHLRTQPRGYCIRANLVSKYLYEDTSPMGVWCFKIEECSPSSASVYFTDVPFTRVRVKRRAPSSRKTRETRSRY